MPGRRLSTIVPAAALALVVLGVSAWALAATRGSAGGDETVVPAVARTPVQEVAQAQALLKRNGSNDRALAELAGASLDLVRETGDPSWYAKAEEAGRRALAVNPGNADALDAMGDLANSRHRFAEGLAYARRSRAAVSTRFAPYGIEGDALVELGRYRQGFAVIERRLELRPDLPSYSRASYVQELRGNRAGAIRLMELAVGAGGPGTEGRAWTQVQLGLLRFGSGDLAGAEREMRAVLAQRPGDARATAGLARVLAARGRLDEAAALYRRALDRLPLPEYPAALAEIDLARGRPAAAREDLALVKVMQRLFAANGVRVDLDLALIDADFHRPGAGGHRPGPGRLPHTAGDHRRRHPGLGAHPGRALRRVAPLCAAQPAARHPRRAHALPRRDGRGVRRPAGRGDGPAARGARAQPAVLGALGAGGPADPGAGGPRVRRLLLMLAALAALSAPVAASAHPLGNFTINHYARAELSGGNLYVRYVLDMAEIPTFRERDAVSAAGGLAPYARARVRALARDLVVTVDGRRVPLVPVSQTAVYLPGAAGLQVTRLAAWYRAPPAALPASGAHRVALRDQTYAGRLGWKEVVVHATSGARVTGANAPATDTSNELRHYPKDLLSRPLAVTEADFTWTPGRGAGLVGPLTRDPESKVAATDPGGLGGLVQGNLSAGVVIVALLLAMAWGALHSLSPGHGKSMVAAYLVGTHGKARHAFILGGFVTATHTIGVIALGLVTLWASAYILPEDLYPGSTSPPR